MSKAKGVSMKRANSKQLGVANNDDKYFDFKKYKPTIFVYDKRDLDCSPPPELQLSKSASPSTEPTPTISTTPLSIIKSNEDEPYIGAGPSSKKIEKSKNADVPLMRWKKLKFRKAGYEEMFQKSFVKETLIPEEEDGDYTLIDVLNSLAKRLHATFRERIKETKNFKAWIQLKNNYRKTKDDGLFEIIISTKPYLIINENEIEHNIQKFAEYILERNSLVMRESSGVIYHSTNELMIKTTKFKPFYRNN